MTSYRLEENICALRSLQSRCMHIPYTPHIHTHTTHHSYTSTHHTYIYTHHTLQHTHHIPYTPHTPQTDAHTHIPQYTYHIHIDTHRHHWSNQNLSWQDGSAVKGVYCQVWQSKLDPWNADGGMRASAPTSYPLTSKHLLWHVHAAP